MTSKVPAADTDRAAPAEVPWHALAEGELYRRVGSAPDGLSGPAAARRLAEAGRNVRVARRRKSGWAEFAESFTEPLQLLLVSVAVLSFVFGQRGDGFAILGVILLSAAVETASEIRAARAISALDDLSAPHARVRRGGDTLSIPAQEVVPGDVLVLDAGDVVAADARVMAAHGLRVDESALTGEAVSAGKSATTIGSDVDLAERANMVYQGTFVVDGQARAVVVATGSGTQLGALGESVAAQRQPATPLQAAMAQLARLVLVLAVLVSVAVPVLGMVTGQPVKDMILTGLTLAFATVPEELPILVTVLLAVGGLQLARRGAILRRLGVGETLGSVTYLLTDKTGTLTENRMILAAVHGNRDRVLSVAYAAQGADSTSTDPMDAAVAAAAHAAGIVPPGELVEVWPFDADRKRVSRLWRVGAGAGWLAVAGAPESVAARCRGTDLDRWAGLAETEAADGRRCIAVASRSTPLDGRPGQERADGPVRLDELAADDAEHGLSMEGLLVFEDPLRAGVPAAVAELIGAGVATIVVTGDHPSTGRAVAAAAGLPAGATLRGGVPLASLGDEELLARLGDGAVVGRATPADKLRLVTLLQARGEVVAVTGDGVNDAPALAAADAGIAMGARGTDLARQAAGLVLTDDSYATVARAIGKGRSITSQLRRAVAFYLGAKVALVAAVVAALLAGHPAPYAPVQIVLLELFMDIGASVAFVSEPEAPGAMTRPPRPPGARFVDGPFLRALAVCALTLALAVAPSYLLLTAHGADLGQARAGAVFAWLAGHTLIAWSLRARPTLSWRENPAFPAWAITALAVAVLVASTPAAALVRVNPLTPAQLATTGAVTAGAVLLAWIIRPLARTSDNL